MNDLSLAVDRSLHLLCLTDSKGEDLLLSNGQYGNFGNARIATFSENQFSVWNMAFQKEDAAGKRSSRSVIWSLLLEEVGGHVQVCQHGHGSQLGRYRPGQLVIGKKPAQSTKRRDHK